MGAVVNAIGCFLAHVTRVNQVGRTEHHGRDWYYAKQIEIVQR